MIRDNSGLLSQLAGLQRMAPAALNQMCGWLDQLQRAIGHSKSQNDGQVTSELFTLLWYVTFLFVWSFWRIWFQKKNQGRGRCSFGGGVGVGPMGPRVRRGITGGKLTLSTLKDGDFPVRYVSLEMVIYHVPYIFW